MNKKDTKPKPQKGGQTTLKKGKDSFTAAPAAIGSSFESRFEVSSFKHPRYGSSIRIRGQDYLASVKVPTSDAPGKVMSEIYISPSDLGFTRLSKFAELYEKYLFKDFKVKYVPAVGSSQMGSVVLAYDRDIQDETPPASEVGLRRMMSWQGAKQTSVWRPVTIDCPLEQPDTGYYTSPNGVEDRLAYQGQVYVATVSPTGLSTGSILGNLWIEYDILLFVPQLEDVEIINKYNAQNVQPTLTDQFLPFAPQNTPTPAANNSPLPILNPAGTGPTTVDLPEGLYELMTYVNQNQVGSVAYATPTLTAKLNQPAYAPAPQVRNLLGVATAGAGQTALQRVLLNVPRGGALMQGLMNSVTGLGASAVHTMTLNRLGDYVASTVFNGLFA